MAQLTASRSGLEQIVQFEISSDAYYNRRLTKPTWPGGASGVTIGIGYDLGHNSTTVIRNDWQNKLSDPALEALLEAAGKTGREAKHFISKFSGIEVPLDAAKQVFYISTLPRYAKNTLQVYPDVVNLPADAQTMLLSLVFNRGTAMDGDRRREMKAIKPLVELGDLQGAMKRLWNIRDLPGLHKRRDKEAELIENARTSYPPGELVAI
jgi:hypothetical protein